MYYDVDAVYALVTFIVVCALICTIMILWLNRDGGKRGNR